MSFSRIKPSSWAVGDKLTSAQMNALDIQLANALDKTSAGDTLAGAIVVASTGSVGIQAGGGSVFTQKAGGINSQIAGGIAATVAGGIASGVDGGIALTGDASDWITYATVRPVTRVVPCETPGLAVLLDGSAASALPSFYQLGYSGVAASYIALFGLNLTTALQTTSVQANQYRANGIAVPLNEYLVDGATLGSAVFTFVTGTKAALPQFPFFGVFRMPLTSSGGPLGGPTLIAAAPGWAVDSASTVSAYSNHARSISQTMNAAGALNVIDKTQYIYFALLFDEYGPNAQSGNTFTGITLSMTVSNSKPG